MKTRSPIENYFIKNGYVSRTTPDYFVDDETERTGIVWQPDVYPYAAWLGKRLGVSQIIDIGCGRAQNVSKLSTDFCIVGIDYGQNIDFCRNNYPSGKWIEHDLDSAIELPWQQLTIVPSILICADVIEHLVHPEILLVQIQTALRTAHAAVISTPERDLTRGMRHMGPPPNPCHVREWSLEEFAALLQTYGFQAGYLGLTRSNSVSPSRHTIIATLYPHGSKETNHLHIARMDKRALLLHNMLKRITDNIRHGIWRPL
jgi:hypothetical protein